MRADRWIWISRWICYRRIHLWHDGPGHCLCRLGSELVSVFPWGDVAGRGAAQPQCQAHVGAFVMTTPTAAIIEMLNISKSYAHIRALDDVSLAVRAGEVTCVLGDNGAGKSTLIKTMG